MDYSHKTTKWYNQESGAYQLYVKQLINTQTLPEQVQTFAKHYLDQNESFQQQIKLINHCQHEEEQRKKSQAEAQKKFQHLIKQLDEIDKDIMSTDLEIQTWNMVRQETEDMLKKYASMYNESLKSLKSQIQPSSILPEEEEDDDISSKTKSLSQIKVDSSSIQRVFKAIRQMLKLSLKLVEIQYDHKDHKKQVSTNSVITALANNTNISQVCRKKLKESSDFLTDQRQILKLHIINLLQKNSLLPQLIKNKKTTISTLDKIQEQQGQIQKIDVSISELEKQYKSTLIHFNNMRETVIGASMKEIQNGYILKQQGGEKITNLNAADSQVYQYPNHYIFVDKKLSKRQIYFYTIWLLMISMIAFWKLQ